MLIFFRDSTQFLTWSLGVLSPLATKSAASVCCAMMAESVTTM